MLRIGHGYDAHRLVEGRKLILGGVQVPFRMGLAGHSDADVLSHAVGHALLGALRLGDLGENFPDSDPQWANVAGSVFLQRARQWAFERGFQVGNCDVTILAETPRLGAHKASMAVRIAEMLDIPAGRVSVKAKTNEQMGAIGRSEGIAVLASVLVMQKNAC